MRQQGDILAERYKVVRLVGKGGMAFVYEVQDLTLPRRWALKEFHPDSLKDHDLESVRMQFNREVELLGRLSHSRLPCVGDSFNFEGYDYMVMEFIEGKTLDQMIRERSEPFPEEQVRKWALQILEILEYLHGQDPPVIYRDVKPQNIIIDEHRGVRFIDFGIARLFNPVKDQDTIYMGTPGFAAPEQFRQRQTDMRSDIYSLGATLHYLLSLRDPGLSPFDFQPLAAVNPGISPLMDRVVLKAVEIKAENRFQSARDMMRVITGECSFEDLFISDFLILNPRELSFPDCIPGKRDSKVLTVRSSSEKPIEGHITASHQGVSVEPSALPGPSATLTVSVDPLRFPRGEKTVASLHLSTAAVKMAVPVSIEVRPTLLMSLPPAQASLLFILIPLLCGLAWKMALLPLSAPSVSVLFLIMGAAFSASLFPEPWKDRRKGFIHAGFCILLTLMGYVFAADSSSALFPDPFVLSALFLVSTFLVSSLLYCLASRLTRAQRRDLGIIMALSYFIFPLSLFIIHFFSPLPQSFLLYHRLFYFSAAAVIALFFVCISLSQWSAADDRTSTRSLLRKGRKPLLSSGASEGLLFLCHVILFIMLFFSLQSASLCPAPLTIPWVPGAVKILFYTASGLFAVIFLLHILHVPPLPPAAGKCASLILSALVFLNLLMALESRYCLCCQNLKQQFLKQPETFAAGISFPAVRTAERDYVKMLSDGRKQMKGGDSAIARDAFDRALEMARRRGAAALSIQKLRLICNGLMIMDPASHVDSDRLIADAVELYRRKDALSYSKICYFSDESWICGQTGSLLCVPPPFFLCLIPVPGASPAAHVFSSDGEVLAASLYYAVLAAEGKGDLRTSGRLLVQLEEIVPRCADSPLTAFLAGELNFQKGFHRGAGFAQQRSLNMSLYRHAMASGNRGAAAFSACSALERDCDSLKERVTVFIALSELSNTRCRIMYQKFHGRGILPEKRDEALFMKTVIACSGGSFLDAFAHIPALQRSEALMHTAEAVSYLRDCAVYAHGWNRAIELSERLRKCRRLEAMDFLKWGFSYDITGRQREAFPLYRAYLARADGSMAGKCYAVQVRNRLAGGPLASNIIMLRPLRNGFIPFMEVQEVSEGVPPDFPSPGVAISQRKGEEPAFVSSDNISLNIREDKDVPAGSILTPYWLQVTYRNLKQQETEKGYRFHLSVTTGCAASDYLLDWVSCNPYILNSQYVKVFPPWYIISREARNNGYYLKKLNFCTLLVAPATRFDEPYSFRYLSLLNYNSVIEIPAQRHWSPFYIPLPSDLWLYGCDELSPEKLLRVFSREPGEPPE